MLEPFSLWSVSVDVSTSRLLRLAGYKLLHETHEAIQTKGFFAAPSKGEVLVFVDFVIWLYNTFDIELSIDKMMLISVLKKKILELGDVVAGNFLDDAGLHGSLL